MVKAFECSDFPFFIADGSNIIAFILSFDIDVFYNRVVIDAKSILGVMSLDLTQILTVEYMGEDAEYEAFLDTMEANSVTAA